MRSWRMEIEADMTDDLADWLFDQIADLVHNTDGIIDPLMSARTEGDKYMLRVQGNPQPLRRFIVKRKG